MVTLFRCELKTICHTCIGQISQVCVCLAAQSCPTLCDPMVGCQAPLFLEFSRQEYWSRLPFPLPRDLPNPEIKPKFLALQADSLPSEPIYKCRQQNKIVISSICDFATSRNHRYFHNHLVGGYILKWFLCSLLCQQRSV